MASPQRMQTHRHSKVALRAHTDDLTMQPDPAGEGRG
eukprot:CAMPEP_0206426264 /NCGR_PEP_ID=MMETSP0324_2-20121206/4272_1 /ASSEMBLY_ACC=CAM_ASM_000836 /TAXON_ID=2866 /ORGANISM="Crypthecodinium cohnii, Strain Seligo" /LENGTH=36 /DNA_ID= /DNA_START= /DNA_END= /DNA_ORIENTATION=